MTVILIDAKNALFRFGWAFKGLQASNKQFTGASYGIMKLLIRLKRRYPDGKFIFVWDGAGKSWRHEFYDQYKANRVKTGPIAEGVQRILAQIPTVTRIGELLNIPQFNVAGLEGDDGVSLLARRIIHDGATLRHPHKVVVYSSDRDFIQLMSIGVRVIHDAEEPVNEAWVNLKFRCTPDKVLLVRAISGDKSDHIPGILDGVGTVRAAEMIAAGCNPSYSDFDMHDFRTQRAFHHLRPRWEEIHRNYRLMRLLDFPLLEKTYGKEMCARVYKSVQNAVAGLDLHSVEGNAYRAFLALLGEMDMVECIAERYGLWRIQRVSFVHS